MPHVNVQATPVSKAKVHMDLLPEQKPMAIVGEDDYTKRKCAPALT